MNMKKISKEKESIEILKILGLINEIEDYRKIYNYDRKNINKDFRLEKIEEIRNYLIKDIDQYELMSKKHKKVCRVLNYID